MNAWEVWGIIAILLIFFNGIIINRGSGERALPLGLLLPGVLVSTYFLSSRHSARRGTAAPGPVDDMGHGVLLGGRALLSRERTYLFCLFNYYLMAFPIQHLPAIGSPYL